jgi:hypothetical protein
MTIHSDNFLVNKTKRCTEFQVYLVSQLYMFQAASLPIIRSSALYIGTGTLLQLDDCLLPGGGGGEALLRTVSYKRNTQTSSHTKK